MTEKTELSQEAIESLHAVEQKFPAFGDVTKAIVDFAKTDAKAALVLSETLNHMITATKEIGVPEETVAKCYAEALQVAKAKSREELEFDYVAYTLEITNARSKVHTAIETLGSILGRFKLASVSKSAFQAMTGEADVTEAKTDLAQ